MSNYPVSEQISRGAELFEAILDETPVRVANGNAGSTQTRALELDEPWGPFTHVSMRGVLGTIRYLGNSNALMPRVELAMRFDPETGIESGLVGVISHYEMAIPPGAISPGSKLEDYAHEMSSPWLASLDYRHRYDISTCPADRHRLLSGNGLLELRGRGEMRPDTQPLIDVLRHGLDTLEGLGSAGIILALENSGQPATT